MTLKRSNFFKPRSGRTKRLSLILKTLVGGLSMTTWATGNPNVTIVLLFAGAAIDTLMEFLPPDEPIPPTNDSTA